MRRPATELPFTCVTCEAEITTTPVFHVGLPFCCAGCVADGPCMCSYDEEDAGNDRPGDGTVPVAAGARDDERRLAVARS